MRVAIAVLLGALLCGCAAPSPSPSPTSSSSAIAIDCGPYANDFPDCLAIVAAASKLVDSSPVSGSRVEVTRGAVGDQCPAASGCVQLAAASMVAHVKFITPTGAWASADVITNPLGGYVGVNPAP